MEDGWCWVCVAGATEDDAALADTSTATLPDKEEPPATGGTTWNRGGGREGKRERENKVS